MAYLMQGYYDCVSKIIQGALRVRKRFLLQYTYVKSPIDSVNDTP